MSKINEDIRWYKQRNYITQIGTPKKITDKDTLLKYVTQPTITPDIIDHIDAGGVLYDNISTYLTFTALEDGEFGFSKSGLSYSIDNGLTWTELNTDETISVSAGAEILWKATTPLTGTTDSIGTFISTGTYDVRGNVLSLLIGDEFASKDSLVGYIKCFFQLFSDSKIVHAHNLILRANTLSEECYHEMFLNSASLISAPELPAMNLAASCYKRMFKSCTSLKNTPNLPAIIMKDSCYWGMFTSSAVENCTSLPSKILAPSCYGQMYLACQNITTAPELPATKLTSCCYQFMFQSSSLKYPPKLPATKLTFCCYACMFDSCTSLTTVPELPATELAESCYNFMFNNCTSLTTVPELPATELAPFCYHGMFQGCTSLTEAQKVLPAYDDMLKNSYCMMFRGCTSLIKAPEIMIEGLVGEDSLRQMFDGCVNLTQAPSELKMSGFNGIRGCSWMFRGCTNLTKAPILRTQKLNAQAYYNMFQGCSKLNYIKALFTEIESNSLTNWVSGVSATGTFIKNPNMTTLSTGVAGIPSGWNVYDDGSEPDDSGGTPPPTDGPQ